MAKRAPSKKPPAADDVPNNLRASVDRLTAELRILRQVIDEVREDFSWITRKGIPAQPIEHVHVRRMALDPLADDWNERLELGHSTFPVRIRASPLEGDLFDRLTDDLTRTFEAVAQGQLEAVLSALDGVRAELMAALQKRNGPASVPPPAMPVADPAPHGRLF